MALGSREFDVRATLTTGTERDRLWQLVQPIWPGYGAYAQRAEGRQIRIFRLPETSVWEAGGTGLVRRRYGSIAPVAKTTDWHEWHSPYADGTSALSRRLRLVQQHIGDWLDERRESSLRVVSVCAGQGNDLVGVLAPRSDADRVRAELIEMDSRNVAAARRGVAAAGLRGITVTCADAGDFAAYRAAVPADLVLLAGVLGNISDVEVRATINALPRLCAPGATVIWTRTRRAPDLTPAVRQWFTGAGFTERAFHAPPDVLFSVGVHRFHGQPERPPPSGLIFSFRV